MSNLLKVVAVRKGIYQDKAYFPGQVFEVQPHEFADVNDIDAQQATFGWMERYDESRDKTLKDQRNASEQKITENEKKTQDAMRTNRPVPYTRNDALKREVEEKRSTMHPAHVVVQSNILPKTGEVPSGFFQQSGGTPPPTVEQRPQEPKEPNKFFQHKGE